MLNLWSRINRIQSSEYSLLFNISPKSESEAKSNDQRSGPEQFHIVRGIHSVPGFLYYTAQRRKALHDVTPNYAGGVVAHSKGVITTLAKMFQLDSDSEMTPLLNQLSRGGSGIPRAVW
jgi:hypothetical protein